MSCLFPVSISKLAHALPKTPFIMTKQRAVHLKHASIEDPISGLEVVETDRPTPGQGEVLVRINLRPVNPADTFSLQGIYPGFQPKAYPAVPGLEGVGVVEENGPGSSKYGKGQRVVGAPWPVETGNGTWQQYMAVREDRLFPVPDSVPDEAAAQFFINPVAVYGMLHVLQVPKGEWLLQTAAGSVLGRQTIQLAKHYGISTINVVRNSRHVQELKDLGADEVIVSGEEDVVKRTKEITGGKGAYAAIDCVGGDLFAEVVNAVRDSGTAIIYGAMSGMEAKFSIPDLLFRDITLRGFWIATWMREKTTEQRGEVVANIMRLLQDNVITPYAGEKFPMDKIKEAVQRARAPGRGGKVLLEG